MRGSQSPEVRNMSDRTAHDGESPEAYVQAAARAGLKITVEHAADVADNVAARRGTEESLRAIDISEFEPAATFRPRRVR